VPEDQWPSSCQVRVPRAWVATSTHDPRGVVADHDATSSVKAKPGASHGPVHVVTSARRESRPSAGDHASYRMLRATRRPYAFLASKLAALLAASVPFGSAESDGPRSVPRIGE
jgi:hypothetical protein